MIKRRKLEMTRKVIRDMNKAALWKYEPSSNDAEALDIMEKQCGFQYSNSPTLKAKYTPAPQSDPQKCDPADHKIHTTAGSDVLDLLDQTTMILMPSYEGVTATLTYHKGRISKVSMIKDDLSFDITHMKRAIGGIPEIIPFEEDISFLGTVFLYENDFKTLQETLVFYTGKEYPNPVELLHDSLRSSDVEFARGMGMTFLPYAIVGSQSTARKGMKFLLEHGFAFDCHYLKEPPPHTLKMYMDELLSDAKDQSFPMDGFLFVENSKKNFPFCTSYFSALCKKFRYNLPESTFSAEVTQINQSIKSDGSVRFFVSPEDLKAEDDDIEELSSNTLWITPDVEVGSTITITKERSGVKPYVKTFYPEVKGIAQEEKKCDHCGNPLEQEENVYYCRNEDCTGNYRVF